MKTFFKVFNLNVYTEGSFNVSRTLFIPSFLGLSIKKICQSVHKMRSHIVHHRENILHGFKNIA